MEGWYLCERKGHVWCVCVVVCVRENIIGFSCRRKLGLSSFQRGGESSSLLDSEQTLYLMGLLF